MHNMVLLETHFICVESILQMEIKSFWLEMRRANTIWQEFWIRNGIFIKPKWNEWIRETEQFAVLVAKHIPTVWKIVEQEMNIFGEDFFIKYITFKHEKVERRQYCKNFNEKRNFLQTKWSEQFEIVIVKNFSTVVGSSWEGFNMRNITFKYELKEKTQFCKNFKRGTEYPSNKN